MSQFNYALPSGAKFTMQAPAGTTQAQADKTFYSQVAAGALVGFKPGQSISGTKSTAIKFALSRLDRGTAGVDDKVILAIVNGLPTINTQVGGIPSLVNTPLQNPVTQANIAAIAGSGFTAPAIGSLTKTQVQALMAQVSNTVGQPATTVTDVTGVGLYGFSCQQLEIAGYVKPGTWQQFIQNGPSTLTQVLSAPGIWTGLHGIYSLSDFLNSTAAQNDAQATLMKNGYNSLQAAGVITTPAAQSISPVVGEVYTGSNTAVVNATATLTNSVNSQVAALITNSSQYGTQLTAQWAEGLPAITSGTSNQTSIAGLLAPIAGLPNLGSLLSGQTPNLASVQSAMNVLGKASQFAANAASTISGALSNISLSSLNNVSLSSLTANLPSVSSITGKLEGATSALLTQAQNQLQGQASALLNQAEGQLSALVAQGDSLVATVQKAAGFTNTVNRASVDVAMTKIFGSSKIPDSASIAAALDISKAQSTLKDLQGQGATLLGQAQGLANQAQNLVGQAQGQANNLVATANNAVNQLG